MGRTWIMPAGAGLPLSLLLRPRWLQPGDAYLLTMLAAVALCQAVEQVAALPALLKWPNDLLVAGPDGNLRKAAGILTELDIQAGMINWAVIGIGVNIAWQPVGLVDGRDLAQTATSLSAAVPGSTVSRSAVLSALLVSFTDGLDQIRTGEHAQMVETWRSRLATIGQAVTIRLPDRTIAGLAEGVDATGALLVRDQQGQPAGHHCRRC